MIAAAPLGRPAKPESLWSILCRTFEEERVLIKRLVILINQGLVGRRDQFPPFLTHFVQPRWIPSRSSSDL